MSQLILDNGWNFNCLLSKYRGIDYRLLERDINPTSRNGDPYWPGAYFGETIRPEEVVFFKINRLAVPSSLDFQRYGGATWRS